MRFHRFAVLGLFFASAAAVAALLVPAAAPAAGPEEFRIDPVHSTVIFRVSHLGASYSYGRFNDISGRFTFDAEKPGNCKFAAEIKVASIDTANADRDAHLRSDEFFDAEKYPTIRFASRTVARKSDREYEVEGELTLHGVTRPLKTTLEYVGRAENPRFGIRAGFETVFTIKRSDFGMSQHIGVVGDEVRLIVSLEGIREGPQ